MFETLSATAAKKCSFGKWFASIDEADQNNITAALEGRVAYGLIAAAIRAEASQSFSPDTISAHQRGKCTCSTD